MEAEKQRVEKARAELTDLHIEVWNYFKIFGKGRANAIPKKNLMIKFNCSDRKIRQIVGELKTANKPVGAVSNGAGYFIPANSDEALHIKNEILKRARNTAMTARTFDVLAEQYKARGM